MTGPEADRDRTVNVRGGGYESNRTHLAERREFTEDELSVIYDAIGALDVNGFDGLAESLAEVCGVEPYATGGVVEPGTVTFSEEHHGGCIIPTEKSEPQVIVGLSREQVPEVVYRDAYYWTCEVCGWLGTGLLSIVAAQQEAGRHVNDRHPEAGPPYNVERRDLRRAE